MPWETQIPRGKRTVGYVHGVRLDTFRYGWSGFPNMTGKIYFRRI